MKKRIYIAYRGDITRGGELYESEELCVSYDEWECDEVIYSAGLRMSEHDRKRCDMYVAWYDVECMPGETAMAAYNRAWDEGTVF